MFTPCRLTGQPRSNSPGERHFGGTIWSSLQDGGKVFAWSVIYRNWHLSPSPPEAEISPPPTRFLVLFLQTSPPFCLTHSPNPTSERIFWKQTSFVQFFQTRTKKLLFKSFNYKDPELSYMPLICSDIWMRLIWSFLRMKCSLDTKHLIGSTNTYSLACPLFQSIEWQELSDPPSCREETSIRDSSLLTWDESCLSLPIPERS